MLHIYGNKINNLKKLLMRSLAVLISYKKKFNFETINP